MWLRSLGWEDPSEKEMATHCGILAWRIPWTEEPGGLQFMRLQRVRHDWVTDTHTGRRRREDFRSQCWPDSCERREGRIGSQEPHTVLHIWASFRQTRGKPMRKTSHGRSWDAEGGTSLAVQMLRHCISTARNSAPSLVRELRSSLPCSTA